MTKVMVTSPTTTVLVAGGGGPVFVGYSSGIDAYKIRGVPVSVVAPGVGEALVFNGTAWVPANIGTQLEIDAIEDALDAVSTIVVNHVSNVLNPHAVTKAQVGLALVENTALSTWAGSAAITTIGTLVAGAVPASLVTAGTFGAGNYVFPADVSVGRLFAGSAASISVAGISAKVQSFHTAGQAGFAAARFSADTSGAIMALGKSRGAAVGTFAIVADGDVLGILQFGGDDGTDLDTQGALIRAVVSGTPAANRMPTAIQFWTAAGVADNDRSEKMRLSPTGTLRLGTTTISAGSTFEINAATGTATLVPVTARLRSVSTGNDYAVGAANFYAAYETYSDDPTAPGASVRTRISTHKEVANGSADGLALWVSSGAGIAVSVTLNSDLTVDFAGAIKRAGTQVVNTRRTGWTTVPTGTLARTTFVSDTVTTLELAKRVAALIVDLHSAGHGLIGA